LGSLRVSIQNCGWLSLLVSRLSNISAVKTGGNGGVFQQAARAG
jgi:hypothetical protein